MRVCVILTDLQIINLGVNMPCPSAWAEIESELGKEVIAAENEKLLDECHRHDMERKLQSHFCNVIKKPKKPR